MGCEIKTIPVDKDIRQYESIERHSFSNIDLLLPMCTQGKGIIYTDRIGEEKRLWDELIKLNVPTIPIWSINNKEEPMQDNQEDARDFIIKNQMLPPEYNVVIINKSCETGINIFGELDFMIINSQSEDTQIQVRGRYRNDLKLLYYRNNDSIDIPDEFLSKELFKEGKKALCEALRLRDENSRIVGWTTVKKKILEEKKYSITSGRKKDLWYVIIEKEPNFHNST